MVTDIDKLIFLCDEELRHREYKQDYYLRLISQWENLREWMKQNGFSDFSEELGNRYCDEVLGTHLAVSGKPARFRERLRSIRILISYQKYGEFEFRCPSIEYTFYGDAGNAAQIYLAHCEQQLSLSQRTIDRKRLYLYNFCQYMNACGVDFKGLSVDFMENFYTSKKYSLASRHNAASDIRLFLRYAFDNGLSDTDASVFIMSDHYKQERKLPTTYEEEEIKKIISAVERGSAIGKRDYLILLLAAEYGWRAKDITCFSFDDIDWEKNVIRFSQHKTGVLVEYPLLASVGNAIIDYLKNSRPQTGVPEIIVSHENSNKGKPLSSPTIHSIVTKYMKRAGIQNWNNKKHGPHAMRHSLATNLLKQNIPMPIISTVMGHQRTDTTSIYLSIDHDKLRQCALPIPPLHSPFYKAEVDNG